MPSPFESFITGRQEARAATSAKQTGAFRGLQMEKIRADMKSSIRQAEQTQALGAAQEQFLGGDKAGATRAFAGLGKPGREALGDLGKIETQQQEQQMEQLKRGHQIMKTLPPEQQGDARQAMVASAAGSGLIKEDEADQLSFLAQEDPEKFDEVTAQVLGIEPDLGAASGVISAEKDGEEKNFDLNDPADRKEFIEGGWEEKPGRELSGELGKPEAKALRDYQSATETFINRGNSLVDLLGEDPDANTVVSALERTGANIMTNVRQLVKDGGFTSMEDEIDGYDAAAYDAIFAKHKITSARIKGQIIALSYMQAKIFDKGGRVTEPDFKNAMNSLGAAYSDPDQFKAALEDQLRLADESFRIDYRIRANKPFEGSLGLRETGGLKAGTEEGGFRFKGGDPSKKENWEPVGG